MPPKRPVNDYCERFESGLNHLLNGSADLHDRADEVDSEDDDLSIRVRIASGLCGVLQRCDTFRNVASLVDAKDSMISAKRQRLVWLMKDGTQYHVNLVPIATPIEERVPLAGLEKDEDEGKKATG